VKSIRQQRRASGIGSPVDHGTEELLKGGVGACHGADHSVCIFLLTLFDVM
jgi:hypothetical protein